MQVITIKMFKYESQECVWYVFEDAVGNRYKLDANRNKTCREHNYIYMLTEPLNASIYIYIFQLYASLNLTQPLNRIITQIHMN